MRILLVLPAPVLISSVLVDAFETLVLSGRSAHRPRRTRLSERPPSPGRPVTGEPRPRATGHE